MKRLCIFLCLFACETICCQEDSVYCSTINCIYDARGVLKYVTLQSMGSDTTEFFAYAKKTNETFKIDRVIVVKRDPLVYKLWIGDAGNNLLERFKSGAQIGEQLQLDVVLHYGEEQQHIYRITCPVSGDHMLEKTVSGRKIENTKRERMLTVVDENGAPLHSSPSLGQAVRLRAATAHAQIALRGSRVRYVSCDVRSSVRNSKGLEIIDADGCPVPGGLIDGGFVDSEDKTFATSGVFRMFTLHGHSAISLICQIEVIDALHDKNHCQRLRKRFKRANQNDTTDAASVSINVEDPALEKAKTIIEAAKLQSTQVCLQNKVVTAAVALPSVVAIVAVLLAIIFSAIALRKHKQALFYKNQVTKRRDSVHNHSSVNGNIPSQRSKPPSYASDWKGSNRF